MTSPGAAEYPDFIANVTPKQVGAIGAAYLESMCALAPVADRFIDKLPSNYMYAGLIHLALPHARIIAVEMFRGPDHMAMRMLTM